MGFYRRIIAPPGSSMALLGEFPRNIKCPTFTVHASLATVTYWKLVSVWDDVMVILTPEIKANHVSPPYVNRAHFSLSIYDILAIYIWNHS